MKNRKINGTKADAEMIVTNENGNLKRLPSDFYYDKIELRNYEICGQSSTQMICAVYDCGLDLHKLITPIQCRTPDLLLQMLTLKGELSNHPFELLAKKYNDKIISDNDLNIIIKWCRKNGYPFKPIITEKTNTPFKLMIQPDYKQTIGFFIWDFIYSLNEIYGAFLLFQNLVGQDKLPKETVYISLPPKTGPETEWRDREFIKLQDVKKDEFKSLFENKYQEISFTNRISVKDEIHLEVKAESLFDAAFYQLAILLNNHSKEIRICPLCNKYFEVAHANQKYCLNKNEYGIRTCYPQKKA